MKSIVLKASAGTGKTYRLSLEYLKSLFEGEDFKNILVMTFTRKATAEIRERVIEFLEEMYRDKNSKLYENMLKLNKNLDLSEKNIKRIYLEISENRDRLKIYTIDSFLNNIFKKVISPALNIFSYEIIDDIDNKEILIKVFEKIIIKKEYFNSFKHFFENRTERDINIYIDMIDKLISERWIIEAINKKGFAEREIKQKRDITYFNLVKTLKDFLDNLAKEKKKEDGNYFLKKFYENLFSLDEKALEIFLDKNWEDVLVTDSIVSGSKLRRTTANESNYEIIDKILDDLQYNLAVDVYNKNVIPYEKEIFEFLETLFTLYDEIKFKEKKFTHKDISSYVFKYIEDENLNLIDNMGITNYFKEIFESEFTTVFIDEFQDTSILQWWVLKYIVKQTKNLVCVGDEKQSIYGWRGGEKGLFENLHIFTDAKLEKLDTSYRSSKNIVDITNKIFSDISFRFNEIYGKNWDFFPSKSKSEKKGFYSYIPFDKEDEITAIEKLLLSIKKEFKNNYKNIAVIARNRSQLKAISEAFEIEKIPYIMENNESILEQRAVRFIYRIITFYVKMDLFSLLLVLRDDILGIDDRHIEIVAENFEIIKEFLKDKIDALPPILYKIEDIFIRMKKLYKNMERDRNFVFKCIEEFNITKKYFGENDLENLYLFKEIFSEYDDIIELFKDLSENKEKYTQKTVEKKNAVSLLTIHKSKGLEFETVYFFHEVKRGAVESGVKLYIDMKVPYTKIDNYIFIDKKMVKILKKFGDEFRYLELLEDKRNEEEINNLYVATTRAKNNLIIITGEKVNPIFKESLDAITSLSGEIEIEESEKEEIVIKTDIFNIELREKELEVPPLEEKELDLITEEKRVLGNAIHYYLEQILRDTEDEHKIAYKKTYSKYALIIGEKKLKKILSSEEFRDIFRIHSELFSAKWDYIYPEYTIYKRDEDGGELRRIDRLMVKKATETEKGEVLIIDYKTGGINQEQLNEYLEIIGEKIDRNLYELKGKFIEIKI